MGFEVDEETRGYFFLRVIRLYIASNINKCSILIKSLIHISSIHFATSLNNLQTILIINFQCDMLPRDFLNLTAHASTQTAPNECCMSIPPILIFYFITLNVSHETTMVNF